MASLPKRIVVADQRDHPPGGAGRRVRAQLRGRGAAPRCASRRRTSAAQLEESYARRVAERFDADAVVLASVGELSGADWLNARLYLRSGYLNRQGLVRLEAQRANALGRFLATGKDVPGVLQARGGRRAGGRLAPDRPAPAPSVDPWYTDIAGWSFLGGGLVTLGLGRWINSARRGQAEPGRRHPRRLRTAGRAVPGGPEREVLGRRPHRRRPAGVRHRRGAAAGPRIQPPTTSCSAFSPGLLPGGGGLVVGGRF